MTTLTKKCLRTFLPLLMLLVASNAYAQSQAISGTVVDEKGGVIPNATVKIVDEAKKTLVREVTSDDAGRFQALNVQPGLYTVTVEAKGFKKLEHLKVTLDVNTKLDVGELKLTIGEVSEVVSVTGEQPLIQTNTGEKAYAVDAKQIQELPLNGRNWVALMSTIPGVVSSTRSDFN